MATATDAKSNVILASDAMKKYSSGSLTDKELSCAVKEIKKTLEFLDKCGPEFQFTCNELRRRQKAFEDYIYARKHFI